MKRVIIWTKYLGLADVGGPCGYLYNIKSFIDSESINGIHFYQTAPFREWPLISKVSYYIPTYIRLHFPSLRRFGFFVDVFFKYFVKCKLSKNDILELKQYDFVHVHQPVEILQYFYNKTKVKAKIILTTHNPEPYIDELAGLYNCKEYLNKHKKLRNYLIKRELKAYEIADNIMFPAKEAREPYELLSDLYQDAFQKYNYKFFYVPTALGNVEPKFDNNHILTNYRIPSSALKICYIGRHNAIKGYDLLKESAKKLWEKGIEAYFVIGGKEGPLYRLEDKRWIELGWVDTATLLNEVDLFVLPNQNTYFDLIMLEVLRQGTPVVASYTGGNKWFQNKNLEGIKFFEYGNPNDLCLRIIEFVNLFKKGKRQSLVESNQHFCKSECNMQLYIERYLDSIQKL